MTFPEFCLVHKVTPEEHVVLRRYLAILRYETVLTSHSFEMVRKRRAKK